MPRKPHNWKAASSASLPAECIVFDTETRPEPAAPGVSGEIHRLRLGVAVAFRIERGKRTREKWITFRTAAEFWEFARSRLSKQRPLWVFAHNIAFDLGTVNGWYEMRRRDMLFNRAIIESQISYLEGEWDGMTVKYCDTFNYFHSSIKEMGKAVKLPKLDMPEWTAPDSDWETYCTRDVEIAAACLCHLVAYVRDKEFGPWAITVAGLSFNTYRRRFMKQHVFVHTYEDALKLERAAYYGGIVDTNFVGRVPSEPVFELDVQSMYPYVCTLKLPYKIRGMQDNPTLQTLESLSKRFLCYGDVTLKTADNRYPFRHHRKVYYPLGIYRTSLAHPELVQALERGEIERIHRCTWHEAAPIFEDYMRYFWEEKLHWTREDNPAFRQLAKYFLTNLYGKTGQMTPRWREWNQDTFREIEKLYGLSPMSLEATAGKPPKEYEFEFPYTISYYDITLKCRNYWGIVEVQTCETESRDSYPAIAATVTSYARRYLRRLQAEAGPRHYFYSDTDSIWVDYLGMMALRNAGRIGAGTLGKLDEPSIHAWLHVHGLKDYETDKRVKHKGIKGSARIETNAPVEQLQFPGIKTQLRTALENGVLVLTAAKRLRRVLDRGRVCADGWFRPYTLPDDLRVMEGNSRVGTQGPGEGMGNADVPGR